MKNPELLLRENIRELVSLVKEKNKKSLRDERRLRVIIREFIDYELKEGKQTPDNDPTPHNSTGINVLEDLLKKIVPILEDDYKLLTTSQEQRQSYRAHIVKATSDTLKSVELNNDAPRNQDLEEEIDIEISDEGDEKDDMFIDIRSDKERAADEGEEEDPKDTFGIEGEDTTGRNMAYTTFKKIQSSIINAYDLLSNPDDQELFFDYLIANEKLYFDKFENEIQPNVEEPSNQAYDSAKEEPTPGDDLQLQEAINFEI